MLSASEQRLLVDGLDEKRIESILRPGYGVTNFSCLDEKRIESYIFAPRNPPR